MKETKRTGRLYTAYRIPNLPVPFPYCYIFLSVFLWQENHASNHFQEITLTKQVGECSSFRIINIYFYITNILNYERNLTTSALSNDYIWTDEIIEFKIKCVLLFKYQIKSADLTDNDKGYQFEWKYCGWQLGVLLRII
jgi:hypothetical protein